MMKKIYTLAIVLLVLGVSSCKLGKHYSRPELRLPEQIGGTVPDSVSAGDIRWTDLYTDPVLRQLIRKTLEGNKDLMIAAAKVKESMELRRIAKAGRRLSSYGVIVAFFSGLCNNVCAEKRYI